MTKKYVITDPCYILPEDIWDECCKKCEARGQENWSENFDGIVQEALRDFTQGQAFASSTGYGDWSNEIYGPGVLNHTFAADAGMVCVCRLTEEVEKKLNIKEHDSCVAVFEADELVKVTFDTDDDNWTVVNIVTDKGLIVSNSPEEDEEDEED